MQKQENKKIYINNSKLMEFIDEIATQSTLDYWGVDAQIQINDCVVFTEHAQNHYNEFYDLIESSINRTLNIYSDNELL